MTTSAVVLHATRARSYYLWLLTSPARVLRLRPSLRDTISASIRAKIIEKLEERHWNPSQLARELQKIAPDEVGFSQKNVSDWTKDEGFRCNPTARQLCAIAQVLGVPVAFFFGEKVDRAAALMDDETRDTVVRLLKDAIKTLTSKKLRVASGEP
jgi:transcriptional regulator with XRE-family HTH domain